MAYYLGYENNSDYTTIDLSNKSSADLLGIIKYTCRFSTLDDLKDELYNDSLIPNRDVELAYLIEKGKKDDKNYVRVPNLNQIYLSYASASFNIECIKNYLIENKYNYELFLILYSSYLKKIGVLDDIKEYLISLLSRPRILKIVFEELVNILKNTYISTIINNILGDSNRESKLIQINLLIEVLSNNNDLLCLTFNYLKSHLSTPSSKTLEYLRSIIILQNREFVDGYTVLNDIKGYIDSLINPDNKGKSKINTRDIVDVGAIIQAYKDYQTTIAAEKYQMKNYKPNQDDEDFLEEDDFARLNTTSSDSGIRLRIPDSMRWSKGGENG